MSDQPSGSRQATPEEIAAHMAKLAKVSDQESGVERAREYAKKHAVDEFQIKLLAELLADYARAQRREVIEECAKMLEAAAANMSDVTRPRMYREAAEMIRRFKEELK